MSASLAPLNGISASVGQHAWIAAVSFAVALLRSFGFRRVFNAVMVWRQGGEATAKASSIVR